MNTISEQPVARRRRRLHSDDFKASAVAACMQPGISMAAVAMAHGINANLLRRWVREAEMQRDGVGAAAAGSSAAAMTGTLATVGGLVGGGMAAGIAVTAAAPIAIGGAVYGLYRWLKD